MKIWPDTNEWLLPKATDHLPAFPSESTEDTIKYQGLRNLSKIINTENKTRQRFTNINFLADICQHFLFFPPIFSFLFVSPTGVSLGFSYLNTIYLLKNICLHRAGHEQWSGNFYKLPHLKDKVRVCKRERRMKIRSHISVSRGLFFWFPWFLNQMTWELKSSICSSFLVLSNSSQPSPLSRNIWSSRVRFHCMENVNCQQVFNSFILKSYLRSMTDTINWLNLMIFSSFDAESRSDLGQ